MSGIGSHDVEEQTEWLGTATSLSESRNADWYARCARAVHRMLAKGASLPHNSHTAIAQSGEVSAGGEADDAAAAVDTVTDEEIEAAIRRDDEWTDVWEHRLAWDGVDLDLAKFNLIRAADVLGLDAPIPRHQEARVPFIGRAGETVVLRPTETVESTSVQLECSPQGSSLHCCPTSVDNSDFAPPGQLSQPADAPFGPASGDSAAQTAHIPYVGTPTSCDSSEPSFGRSDDRPNPCTSGRAPDANPESLPKIELVLFVSHRWETAEHPDPTGVQWRAVQRVLECLHTLALASREPDDQRVARVPTLQTQPMLLAAYILGRLVQCTNCEIDRWGQGDPHLFADAVLKRVAIFYDYLCLPQVPRTGEEEDAFWDQLSQLQGLVSSSLVLTLRSEGDDYASRAWCVFEDARGGTRISCDITVLDRAVGLDELQPEPSAEEWEREGVAALREQVKRWACPRSTEPAMLGPNYYGFSGKTWALFGEVWQSWCLLCPPTRNGLPQLNTPRVDAKAMQLAMTVQDLMFARLRLTLSVLELAHGEDSGAYIFSTSECVVPFRDLIHEALVTVGLTATDENDVSFVGFMLCLAAKDEYRALWARCVLRALQRKPLNLPISRLVFDGSLTLDSFW